MANGPSKQQTSSIFSLVLFNWLNETVSKASRVEHLPLDDFPPLADTNATKNLTERSFKVCLPSPTGGRSVLTANYRKLTRSSSGERNTCSGDCSESSVRD